MKKNLLKTTASLLISGLFLFLAFGSGDKKVSNCDTSSSDYQTGVSCGKLAGEDSYGSPVPDDDFLERLKKSNTYPKNIDCFREGYSVGFSEGRKIREKLVN